MWNHKINSSFYYRHTHTHTHKVGMNEGQSKKKMEKNHLIKTFVNCKWRKRYLSLSLLDFIKKHKNIFQIRF